MARDGSRKSGRTGESAVRRKLRAVRRGARHSRKLRNIARLVALVATLLIVAVGVLCLVFPETIVHVLPYLLGGVMAVAGVAGIVAAVRNGEFSAVPAGADDEGLERARRIMGDPIMGDLATVPASPSEGPAASGEGAAEKPASEAFASEEPAVEKPAKGHLIEEESRGVGASFVLAVLGVFSMACGDAAIGFLGVAWGLITLYKLGSEVDEIVHLVRAKQPVAILSTAVAVFELILALLLILAPFENIEHHVLVLGIELILNPFKFHWERGRRGAEIDA